MYVPGKNSDLNRGVVESNGPRVRSCGRWMRTKTALLLLRSSWEAVVVVCKPSRTLAIPDNTAETWALASSKRAALLMYAGVGTWLFLT